MAWNAGESAIDHQADAFDGKGRLRDIRRHDHFGLIKSGRTLVVCTGEVIAVSKGAEQVVTVMQATMMAVRGRPDLVD